MFDNRVFKPEKGDVLYHYCDPYAFLSICQNKKIWFSDLFSMNDPTERKYGYYIWEESANIILEMEKDILSNKFKGDELDFKLNEIRNELIKYFDMIDEVMHFSGIDYVCTAACFSKTPDSLNQWRNYASNGQGFCIGFDANNLVKMNVDAVSVLYNKDKQLEECITEIRKLINLIKENKIDDFNKLVNLFCLRTMSFKHPAYLEENEVRLLYRIYFESNLRLFDKVSESSLDIKHRIRDNSPVVYIEKEFSDAIKEVIIGPKNYTLPSAITVLLETSGISNVEVTNSSVPYR